MAKCIRCGKPCNNGENMCDECRAWFQEKTGGSTPASGSKVTKKSETSKDETTEKAVSKNKNVEASIKEDEPVNIAKRGEFTEHNGAKTSSSRKYIVLIIALIAISTVVVLFYLSGQKNKDNADSSGQDETIIDIEADEHTEEAESKEEFTEEVDVENTENELEQITSLDSGDNLEESDSTYYVKNVDAGLNVRSEPKNDSALVYTVEDDSIMTYLGEMGEGYGSDNELHTWYKITINGHTGWVRSDLVDQARFDNVQDIVVKDIAQPFYGVWVSATKNESEAEKMCNELITKGFDARVIVTSDWSNLNPETYYAISIGAHSNKADAETQLAEMKRNGYEIAYIKYSGDCLVD